MKSKLFILILSFLIVFSAFAQQKTDEEAIRKVADNILKQPVNQFVGVKDGKVYNSTREIPQGTDVKFNSPLTEWHYSNGVLDMAMISLGKYLNEKNTWTMPKITWLSDSTTTGTLKIRSGMTANTGTGPSDNFGISKNWTIAVQWELL